MKAPPTARSRTDEDISISFSVHGRENEFVNIEDHERLEEYLNWQTKQIKELMKKDRERKIDNHNYLLKYRKQIKELRGILQKGHIVKISHDDDNPSLRIEWNSLSEMQAELVEQALKK